MGVRTSDSTPSPRQLYQDLKRNVASFRRQMVHLSGQCDSLTVDLVELSQAWFENLGALKAKIAQVSGHPNIITIAQEDAGDPAYDVVAAWGSLSSAIDDAILWCEANWPMGAGRFAQNQVVSNDGTGRMVRAVVTAPASCTAIKARLTILIDLIDPPA
jgi:hypothetical protein